MSLDVSQILLYTAVMAVVTYGVRALPLTLFRREITNPHIKAFLEYIPYAVLGAMTIPAIFTSTGNIVSALVGLAVAVGLSYMEKSLLTVAAFACMAVFFVERFV